MTKVRNADSIGVRLVACCDVGVRHNHLIDVDERSGSASAVVRSGGCVRVVGRLRERAMFSSRHGCATRSEESTILVPVANVTPWLAEYCTTAAEREPESSRTNRRDARTK